MAADIVITKPAKKEVALKKAATKSVVVDPSTGGGGGGGVKLTPTVEVNGDQLIFHYVTLLQMTMMHISVSGGSIGFELTEDEDDFQLRYSQDSPSPLAGEIVYEDSIAIKDYVFGSISVAMNGNIATFVTIDGVDANLLEADINWRLSDIQQKSGETLNVFDADMALQLQGIIGEGEESVEGNSQTEGEIERLRTLQESYDDLANKTYATTSEVADMDAEILTPYE